ncbi:DivIVA domain-containing protein [Lapidilactobacillus luobeiensis]|uniref:DivIVA domain-containing protein n=1 Tax=Lapidilactobacillus luobeiensis TaxID=2950371 RepID=UPI0021C4072F|nr:DivIVA domain-containing protein [Lapidilactobacillus luobeiensis]
MALKPDDIRNKDFETKFRGLDPEQVKPFLAQIATELGALQEQNQQLTQSLKESQERVSYFTDLKDALNQSIIVAQNAADRVKNNAQHEADMIKTDAEKQSKQMLTEATERSNQILQDASERARHLTIETDDLKKDTRVFHQRLQVLLESQLAMIKTPEWQALLGKSTESSNRVGALLDQPIDRDHHALKPVTPPDRTEPTGTTAGGSVDAESAEQPADPTTGSTDPDPAPETTPSNRPVDPAAEFAEKSQPEAIVPEMPDVPETATDTPVFHYRNHGNQGTGDSETTATGDQIPDNQNYGGVTIVFPDENE